MQPFSCDLICMYRMQLMQVTRLNQKTKRAIFTLQVFDHPEHVFQSSRCESELAASSTAEEANGHPPDTIAIAVHCVSLEGDAPRQVRPRLGQFKFIQMLNSSIQFSPTRRSEHSRGTRTGPTRSKRTNRSSLSTD